MKRKQNKHKIMLGYMMSDARAYSGLTQTQLAKKLKTKQSSIARWEKEGCSSVVTADKFIKACGRNLRFHHVTHEDKGQQVTHFFG